MNGKEVMELFESLPFGICFYTLDSEEFNRENFQFEMGNEEFFQCIGYERERLKNRENRFEHFLDGQEYEKFLSTIERAVENPASIQEIDVGVRQWNGSVSYVTGRMRLVKNPDHKYCICCAIINIDHYVSENQSLARRIQKSYQEMNSLNTIIERFPSGMAVLKGGVESQIVMVNQEFFHSTGYSLEEILNGSRNLFDYCYSEDAAVLEEMQEECLREKIAVERELRLRGKDGNIHWMSMRVCLYTYRDAIPYFLMACWDISDRKRIEDELRLQMERNKLVEELTAEIPMDYDVVNQCFKIDDSIKEQYQFPSNDITLEEYTNLIHEDERDAFVRTVKRAVSRETEGTFEYRVRLQEMGKRAVYKWHRTKYRSIAGNDGKIMRVIGRIYNIDREKRIHSQLEEKARRDSMTQLLNKQALKEEIEDFLSEKPQGIHAFMVIDIDDFKKINDTFGHVFGDTIIQEVSERLKEQFRGMDIIGRVGGDEFVVCMKYTSVEHAKEKAKTLCESIRKRYSSSTAEQTITCSVGITFFGEGETSDYEEMFSKADMAMYQAKMSGKNGYQIADKKNSFKAIAAIRREREEKEKAKGNHFDKEFLKNSFELLSHTKDIDGTINLLLERVGRRYNLNMVMLQENKNTAKQAVMTNYWASSAAYMRTDFAEKKLEMWKEYKKTDRLLVANCNQQNISTKDKQIFRELQAKAYAEFYFGKPENREGSIIFCDCEEPREWTEFEELTLYEFTRMMAVFVAIRRHQEQVEYEIHYLQEQDPLTGLYNLKTFKKKVEQSLPLMGVEQVYAMVCLDINGFSYINENFGHSEGDRVLEKIADYIMAEPSVRFACRRYADLFLMITQTETKEMCVKKILEGEMKFREYMKKKYPSGNICENIGVYFWEHNTYDVEELIENANLARKETKKDQAFCLQVYSESLKEEKNRERIIAASFYPALKNGEFEIYLQPKFLLEERKIYGAEALARWKRLDGRYHNPNEFIPVLEKFGYINDLDFYIFEETVKYLEKWNREGKERMTISSNFSGKHFGEQQGDFVEKICAIADKYEVDYSQLELEITESVAVQELERLQEVLVELRKKGFRIAIDDFGTGYSSLNILFDINVDVVKIDKSFLDTELFEKRKQLIMHIGDMVHLAEEEIVFEGVEKEEQIEFLKECGYKYGQGYIFDEPIRVLDFEQKYLY